MAQPKYIVIGLGNPGQKYADSRHNVGFVVVDELARRLGLEWQFKARLEAEVAKGGDWLLIKPQAYMNRSGRGAKAVLDFYNLTLPDKHDPRQVWVVYDDLDLELGHAKASWAKGPRDHRGINSLTDQLGSQLFWHLRLGIDGRQGDRTTPPEQYVLQPFSALERDKLELAVKQSLRRLMTGDASARLATPDRGGDSRRTPGQLGFASLGNVLSQHGLVDRGGYITQEFQDFGYRLAVELDDLKHKSLYMKLAKQQDRRLLEEALSFVKDANADSPAKLFMWKFKQLRESSQSPAQKDTDQQSTDAGRKK